MKYILFLSAAACLLTLPMSAQAEVRAKVIEKHYAITGKTGLALYESIGAHGPSARGSSAIAITEFDLKWGRDYKRDGNGCVLAVVRPFLTITYTLPKPTGKLGADLATQWRIFIAGIKAHEAVHGKYVLEMAQQIYDTTLGFRQPNDPECRSIRKAIQVPIKAAFDRYKERNRAFEQVEMSDGGNVHQLVLDLVNGP